jgi:chemotaxis-related protein WspD
MNDRQESALPELLVREDETLDGAAILRLLDKPLSADDLREATARVARPLELAEKDVARLLVFRLRDELMAFESVRVNQVARAASVHRIPHRTNNVIRGFCNLDGELMLCADLAKLLELNEVGGATASDQTQWQEEPQDQRRMIVLGDEQNRWVVEVDAVSGVTAIVRDAFRRPPITIDAALARYTKNLVPLDQGFAALLDEQRVISGFQAALR